MGRAVVVATAPVALDEGPRRHAEEQTMAANKYTIGDASVTIKQGMKITDEAINLKDKSSVSKPWKNAESIAHTTADVLTQHPDLLRLPPHINAATLREAADKAQSWNGLLASLRQLVAHVENQNLIDDGKLHDMLLEIRRQYKVQAKADPSLDALFAALDAYNARG